MDFGQRSWLSWPTEMCCKFCTVWQLGSTSHNATYPPSHSDRRVLCNSPVDGPSIPNKPSRRGRKALPIEAQLTMSEESWLRYFGSTWFRTPKCACNNGRTEPICRRNKSAGRNPFGALHPPTEHCHILSFPLINVHVAQSGDMRRLKYMGGIVHCATRHQASPSSPGPCPHP